MNNIFWISRIAVLGKQRSQRSGLRISTFMLGSGRLAAKRDKAGAPSFLSLLIADRNGELLLKGYNGAGHHPIFF